MPKISLIQYLNQNGIEVSLIEDLGLRSQLEQIWSSISPDNTLEKSKEIVNLIKEASTLKTTITLKKEKSDQKSDTKTEETVFFKPVFVNGEKLPDIIASQDQVIEIKGKLISDTKYIVTNVSARQIRTKPKPAFTTSSVQQSASSYLGFNPKLTMQLAQRLYEGVEINGQQEALITYMRTDSVTLSKEAIDKIREYLTACHPELLESKVRVYANKSKNAQEAHEAIRPTNCLRTPSSLKGLVDPKQLRLYDLIWRQTIMTQMIDEVRELTTFELENSLKSRFSGSQSQSINLGWRTLHVKNS
jgi:DNA topoisomerase I